MIYHIDILDNLSAFSWDVLPRGARACWRSREAFFSTAATKIERSMKQVSSEVFRSAVQRPRILHVDPM